MLHWLRPQTHMEWFPYPLQTHTRCLRSFICCGWVNGSTNMPQPSYLFAQNLGSWPNPGSKVGYKWCHGALVEAPDPHGMVSISTPSTYNVLLIIPMLWMGRWIHHSATTIGPDYRKLAKLQIQMYCTIDVMEHWLRSQTHMEWFPYPLQIYTRCMQSFICFTWTDGFTNMPLPSYLLVQILGSWPNSWATAGLQLQMMSWCIG